MMDIGPKIKSRRERLGWSQTKLATLAEISQSFLWRIEAGKVAGSWDTYTRIAEAMGLSVDVFFPNRSNVEDAHLGWRKIPVLSYAQAGQWGGNAGMSEAEVREHVMTDLEHPASTFAMRVRGDSMEPKFAEGDVVVIDPTIQPKPGDYVVGAEAGGETAFRQYRKAGLNEHGREAYELVPLNPIYAPMRSDRQEISIIGVMVEHRTYRRR